MMSAVTSVRRSEWPILLLGAGYFFLLLASYYILRPLRETVGVSGDSRRLALLFSGTLAVMLAIAPLFGWLVNRFARERLIPIVNRAFALQLLLFAWFWSRQDEPPVWLAAAFFIWVSVFNVFVVSVFWSFMTEVHTLEESKRTFGMIAVGGTLGGIFGGWITYTWVAELQHANLLLVSVVLLEVATWCMLGIARRRSAQVSTQVRGQIRTQSARPEDAEAGGIWNGLTLLRHSAFLRGAALHVLLATSIGTMLYMQQAQLVREATPDKLERTALFARIDMWTNGASLLVQIFLTSAVIRRLGIRFALLAQPVTALIALGLLALHPVLPVLIPIQVTLRGLQHALTRPAREMLFTEVGREARYKSKNFLDTFAYRLGDQLGVWSFDALFKALALPLGLISACAAPLGLAWCAVSAWLGREHSRRTAAAQPMQPRESERADR
jgi:AAA family ATP:ADP antiporter